MNNEEYKKESGGETISKVGEFIDEIDRTNVTVYEKLNASNDKAAKQEFLENDNLIHPNNEYGNLDKDEVRQNLAKLDEIEEQLSKTWMDEKEARFIKMIADDSKRKNEFLAANIAYNDAKTQEEKIWATEWHRQANENLYGSPDKDTFYALLDEKISSIDQNALTDEQKVVYDKLLKDVGQIEHSEKGRFKPSQETIDRFSELVKDFFGGFLSHISEDQKSFSAEEAALIVNEIVEQELDGDENVYHAIVDDKVSNASASRGIIRFPSNANYSRERLAALVVHELGTHAMRAIPYQEQEYKTFTTGLPNNETFDEGIAGCVEQALEGEYKDFGVDHYINIGLATFKDKNFREVYEIQKNLKALANEDDSKVLNAVQRCFRGTGELPNNKDLAYYNGVSKVWQYIEKHIDDPVLFDNLFLSGKVDISNPEQERLSYEMRTKGSLH